MKTSEQINEIAEALAAAQGEIQNPGKSAENPFFKSWYADLAEVLSVVRPAFSKHGLSVVQMPYSSDDGAIGVTTMISHKSGQWMKCNHLHSEVCTFSRLWSFPGGFG